MVQFSFALTCVSSSRFHVAATVSVVRTAKRIIAPVNDLTNTCTTETELASPVAPASDADAAPVVLAALSQID